LNKPISKFPGIFLDEEVVLTGWGVFNRRDETSENLLYANLTIKALSECKKNFDDAFASTRLNSKMHLCAQSLSSQDACGGDSGGKPTSQMQILHINYSR